MDIKYKEKVFKLLKSDERLFNKEKNEINLTLIKDLIDKLDKKLIKLLLSDSKIKEDFFIKIDNVYVLKQNELKFFIDENKLDNSYTQYQNKIGLRVGNKLLTERNEVVLDWPFKDCVLEGGMTKEDQKRNEIFFNEVLAKDEIDRLEDPKVLVNWKRYTAKGEEKVKELKRDKNGTIRENLIIKGNNLLALHSLKEQFTGKVKLIYIDPPFNREADAFYNDNFKHSTWLTFMKNRLLVAYDLMANDSLIFVNIDDIEAAYLKVILDDIFNRNNFVNSIAVRSSTPSGLKTAHKGKTIIKQKDYILVYKKGEPTFTPQYQKKDNWDGHYMYFFDRKNNTVLKLKDLLVENGLLNKKNKLEDLNIKDVEFKNFYIKHKEDIFRTAPEMPDEIKTKTKNNPEKIIQYGDEDGVQFAWGGGR